MRVQRRWLHTLEVLPNLKLMTLTIRNGSDLAERLALLDTSFRKLLDFRIGRNNRGKIERKVNTYVNDLLANRSISEEQAQKWLNSTTNWLNFITKQEAKQGQSFKLRKLLKGLSSLEVTYNAEGETWHAHRHLILSMQYIPQIVLTVLWQMATKQEGKIVDIRAIKDVKSGLREAIKYTTKAWEIPEDKADELLKALKGKKRTWVIGRIKPQEEEPAKCPGCNQTDCKCEKVAIVSKAQELDGGGYYANHATDPSAPARRLIITRDLRGRLVWTVENLSEADLSLYRTKYQEKERATSPPDPTKSVSKGGLTIKLPKLPLTAQESRLQQKHFELV